MLCDLPVDVKKPFRRPIVADLELLSPTGLAECDTIHADGKARLIQGQPLRRCSTTMLSAIKVLRIRTTGVLIDGRTRHRRHRGRGIARGGEQHRNGAEQREKRWGLRRCPERQPTANPSKWRLMEMTLNIPSGTWRVPVQRHSPSGHKFNFRAIGLPHRRYFDMALSTNICAATGRWSSVALVLATINQVFSLLDPLIFRHVIDDYATQYDKFTNVQFFRGVAMLLGMAVGVAFVSRVAKNFQDYYVNVVTQRLGAQMYSDGIRHSLSLPFQVFEDQRSGETLGKLQKVRADTEKFIAAFVNVIFTTIVGLIFVMFYAYNVHWSIALAFLLTIPLLGGLSFSPQPAHQGDPKDHRRRDDGARRRHDGIASATSSWPQEP